MTEPGSIIPAQPGWWVRTGRVGVASGSYGWAPTTLTRGTAALPVTATPTAAGVVGEQLTGDVTLAVTAGRLAAGVVGEQLTGDAALAVTANRTAMFAQATFQGANISTTTTVTIPTHAVGELIVVAASADSSTPPPKPAGGGTVPTFTDIEVNNGAGKSAMRVSYAVATRTDHTSGIWLGADVMVAAVIHGQNAAPIGGHQKTSGSTGSVAQAPGITLADNSGTAVQLYFYSCERLTSWAAAPSGYTRRTAGGSSGNPGMCLNTKNVTTSDGPVNQGTVESGRCWAGVTVEIVP